MKRRPVVTASKLNAVLDRIDEAQDTNLPTADQIIHELNQLVTFCHPPVEAEGHVTTTVKSNVDVSQFESRLMSSPRTKLSFVGIDGDTYKFKTAEKAAMDEAEATAEA